MGNCFWRTGGDRGRRRAGGVSAPYSPDVNPIEQVFAKLKSLVCSAGQRTVEGLWNLLGQLLDRFPPKECRNDIRHCGYAKES